MGFHQFSKFDNLIGQIGFKIGGSMLKQDNERKCRDQENRDPKEFADECHSFTRLLADCETSTANRDGDERRC